MKLLLSAYACEPDRGSEPGIGWNWALALRAQGHVVHVLTRRNNRADIEAALEKLPPQLRPVFHYHDLPTWAARWKRGGRGVQLYYYLWQLGALAVARQAHREVGFDAVQHLTFGVFRQPSRMGELGIPFVHGPLGGGEETPRGLRELFPWRARQIERLREAANRLMLWDPWVRRGLRRAQVILTKTEDTRQRLPAWAQSKSRCELEVGLAGGRIASEPVGYAKGERFRLMFVARFIHLKGGMLCLAALARLRRAGVDVTLTLVGAGPQEAQWRDMARQVGVSECVEWWGWRPQSEVLRAYRQHHAFLFPSLHDSSGNAVLEALSQGLPVVCLANGGPAAVVGPHAGLRVDAADQGVDAVAAALADAVRSLIEDEARYLQLSRAALARAADLSWSQVVARVWPPGARNFGEVVER